MRWCGSRTRAIRSPGRTEVCDAANEDEDCIEVTFGDRDTDEDGAIDASCCNGDNCGTDCDDTEQSTHLGANEACDGRDNDCDARIDEGVLVSSYPEADGDGWGTGESEM